MSKKKLILTILLILIIFIGFWWFSGRFVGTDSGSVTWASAPSLDSVPSQLCTVSIKENEVLIGDKGAVLHVQPGTFIDESGNAVNDNIEVELKELNTMNDFVQAGISTLSNGR